MDPNLVDCTRFQTTNSLPTSSERCAWGPARKVSATRFIGWRQTLQTVKCQRNFEPIVWIVAATIQTIVSLDRCTGICVTPFIHLLNLLGLAASFHLFVTRWDRCVVSMSFDWMSVEVEFSLKIKWLGLFQEPLKGTDKEHLYFIMKCRLLSQLTWMPNNASTFSYMFARDSSDIVQTNDMLWHISKLILPNSRKHSNGKSRSRV